jgi:serine protease AprX
MAADDPEARVGVIVQSTSKSDSLERLVARLGGVVTTKLYFINAFAAELPARTIPDLSRTPGVRWVSLDAPVSEASGPEITKDAQDAFSPLGTESSYIQTIGAYRLWVESPRLLGQGIGVAVVDSGIAKHDDLRDTWQEKSKSRVVAWSSHYQRCTTQQCLTDGGLDLFGHGTHVAGIIGGNGAESSGQYVGVAPKVNLINVKVSNDRGAGTTSSVVAGLQWVYEHRTRYNIRVVNLSLTSTVAESYHTSPLDAAVEVLWFNRIVVVVAAGNGGGSGVLYPPANDPFVITVGALDDRGTLEQGDDVVARFSASGVTESGVAKPDLLAPGASITSLLASSSAKLAVDHPDHRASGASATQYFRMSGTSMSSAVATGAIALLLQREPGLTPDQVKFRLQATARPMPDARGAAGAGSMDIYAAIHTYTNASANVGLEASRLLWSGADPITWGSVNWDSVNWDSVNWDSVNWDSVNWDSVNWDSDYWGD